VKKKKKGKRKEEIEKWKGSQGNNIMG